MRKRRQWFEKFEGMYFALWWVEAGYIPSVMEAKQRLDHLNEQGARNGHSISKVLFRHRIKHLKNLLNQLLSRVPRSNNRVASERFDRYSLLIDRVARARMD